MTPGADTHEGAHLTRTWLWALTLGLLVFAVLSGLGLWKQGAVLGLAVTLGLLTPPFSRLRRR